jgi:hypothetical protein
MKALAFSQSFGQALLGFSVLFSVLPARRCLLAAMAWWILARFVIILHILTAVLLRLTVIITA